MVHKPRYINQGSYFIDEKISGIFSVLVRGGGGEGGCGWRLVSSDEQGT